MLESDVPISSAFPYTLGCIMPRGGFICNQDAQRAGGCRFLLWSVVLIGAKPWRVGAGSRFGGADRMRRDRRERPRYGSRERDNCAAQEDGTAQHYRLGAK